MRIEIEKNNPNHDPTTGRFTSRMTDDVLSYHGPKNVSHSYSGMPSQYKTLHRHEDPPKTPRQILDAHFNNPKDSSDLHKLADEITHSMHYALASHMKSRGYDTSKVFQPWSKKDIVNRVIKANPDGKAILQSKDKDNIKDWIADVLENDQLAYKDKIASFHRVESLGSSSKRSLYSHQFSDMSERWSHNRVDMSNMHDRFYHFFEGEHFRYDPSRRKDFNLISVVSLNDAKSGNSRYKALHGRILTALRKAHGIKNTPDVEARLLQEREAKQEAYARAQTRRYWNKINARDRHQARRAALDKITGY